MEITRFTEVLIVERRDFLKAVGATGALCGVGSVGAALVSSCTPTLGAAKNWTWVHERRDRSPEEWRELFARVHSAGIDGVLVSGSDEGVVHVAHEVGLEFHRWTWTLNRTGDEWVKENHPEWFSVSREGKSSLDHPPYVGYYQWLCPTRDEVRNYLRDVVDEISRDPEVDGVHLDYVRHPDVILPVGLWAKYDLVQDREFPEFDFCYCERCRETFEDQTGRDPLDLPDPTVDVDWRRFRWDGVTEVVRGLAEIVRGNSKRISAAVFPTPDIARELVRQDWDHWDLDAVFPMIYNGFYEKGTDWVETASREGVDALGGRIPLYSGLYLPDLSPDALHEAVVRAYDGGASGVSLFEMDGITDEHLERFKEAVRVGQRR